MEKIIRTCPHCGNKTVHKDVFNTSVVFDRSDYHEAKEYYHLLQCSTCDDLTLVSINDYVLDFMDEPIPIAEYYQLYPIVRERNAKMPSDILKSYDKIKAERSHSFGNFAINIRKLLELMLEERGISEDTLHKSITRYGVESESPLDITRMMNIIREFGNEAAHGKKEITWEMTSSIDYCFNKVFDYVYHYHQGKLTQAENLLSILMSPSTPKSSSQC